MKNIGYLIFAYLIYAFHTQSHIMIANGSFEEETKGWTNKTENGSKASFLVSKENTVDGTSCLLVDVKKLTLDSSSIRSTHEINSLTKENRYILTFYAKAKSDHAFIQTMIQQNDSLVKSFRLSSSWEKYAFEFISNETDPILQFVYNTKTTYYIDNIQIEEGDNS